MSHEEPTGSTPITIAELDAEVEGLTVPRRFLDLLAAHPDDAAVQSMNGDGGWDSWTWGEVGDLVARAAAGLASLGIGEGDRVLLMMRNRPDFHWLDLAAQFVRARPSASTTRRHPTRSPTSPVMPRRGSPSSRTTRSWSDCSPCATSSPT
ncbi:MAG: AMP-binding protein [Ilumatobacteraceae bacterium]